MPHCPSDAGGAASNGGTACLAAGGAPSEPSVPVEEKVQRLPGAGPQPAGGGAGGPAGGHRPVRQQQPLAGSQRRSVHVCLFYFVVVFYIESSGQRELLTQLVPRHTR